jgi:hypothetical protein
MTESIVIQETLTLDTNPAELKQWLVSYYMSQHPTDEPSVWETFDGGEVHLSYHASPNGRLTFVGKAVAPGKLAITRISCQKGWEDYCRELVEAMQLKWSSKYSLPDFVPLVKDSELARVLEIRWEESNRTFRAEAYLSTIVLLGSILEGVLLAKVQQNPKQANQAKSAPKDQNGKPLPFDRWRLNHLITVAHECGWLDADVRVLSYILRDYRNLVHPREQAKRGLFPDAGTCRMAQEVVAAAFEDLVKLL